MKKINGVYHEDPIHPWFGLSYASYLVLPRSILQAMPYEWQKRMVALLEEAEDIIDWQKIDENYNVLLRDRKTGRYKNDPLANYRHGNKLAESLVEAP